MKFNLTNVVFSYFSFRFLKSALDKLAVQSKPPSSVPSLLVLFVLDHDVMHQAKRSLSSAWRRSEIGGQAFAFNLLRISIGLSKTDRKGHFRRDWADLRTNAIRAFLVA